MRLMEYTRLLLPGSFLAKLDVGLAVQSGLLSVLSQWCRPGAAPSHSRLTLSEQVGRVYPQAVYFPIRTLYLTLKIEQRERYKSGTSPGGSGQAVGRVPRASGFPLSPAHAPAAPLQPAGPSVFRCWEDTGVGRRNLTSRGLLVPLLRSVTRCSSTPVISSISRRKYVKPRASVVKNLPAKTGAVGSIPGSERSPEVGNGNPLQYSCLGNPMDRESDTT